jgi:hypothetical protein
LPEASSTGGLESPVARHSFRTGAAAILRKHFDRQAKIAYGTAP